MTNEMKLLQAKKLIYEVVQDIYKVDPEFMIVFVHQDSISFTIHDEELGLSYEVTAREKKA